MILVIEKRIYNSEFEVEVFENENSINKSKDKIEKNLRNRNDIKKVKNKV